MLSVRTNLAAATALRHLHAADREAAQAEQRLASGRKISSAKDNAASWAIAQRSRSEARGLDVVRGSLERSKSIVEVSIAGAERIRELLVQLKELSLAASDRTLDTPRRALLDQEFVRLRNSINPIANNTTFAGVNMIRGGRNASQLGKSVSPLADPDGGVRITVAAENLGLRHNTNNPTSLLSVANNSRINTIARATAMIATVDASLQALSGAVGRLAAGAQSLERHLDYTGKLKDGLEAGVAQLVDADLGRESARLTALQSRKALGLEALRVANAGPTAALALFI